MSDAPQRLRWGVPEQPPPKRPYRDTLLVYGALAVLVVVIAWATGGPLGKSVLIAAAFFVVATAWNIWRWRIRLRDEARRQQDGT